MTGPARVITSGGRCAISSPDVGLPRALVFRQDDEDILCDECCSCDQRCFINTGGYGCALGKEGDEHAIVSVSAQSSGTVVEECADTIPVRFKNTQVSGSGVVRFNPAVQGFRCGQIDIFHRGFGFVYRAEDPPGFCGDCDPCPLDFFGDPRPAATFLSQARHDIALKSNTVSVVPEGCFSGEYSCFGELVGLDSASIPESQVFSASGLLIHSSSNDVRSELFGGSCPPDCNAVSYHAALANFRLIYSPVTDRHAGFLFSSTTGATGQVGADEVGTVTLSSVVAVIRGGLAGVRWSADISSTATQRLGLPGTRTRSVAFDASVDFPHFGLCCDGGSRRVEDVVLVGPGGGGAAFASDPIFHASPSDRIVVRPRRKRRRRACSGCRGGWCPSQPRPRSRGSQNRGPDDRPPGSNTARLGPGRTRPRDAQRRQGRGGLASQAGRGG